MTDNLSKYIRDSHHNLLIVEDSDADFSVLNRFLQKLSFNSPIHRCYDGEDALDYLYHKGNYQDNLAFPRPSLILLDLNLPGTDGKDVLEEIKQDENLKIIPVVVFTTSSNPQDVQACYQRGANNYILKPMDLSEMREKVESLLNYWFNVSTLPSF